MRGAHLDETHGFFNGTSVFLRVHGQEQLPCLVDLAPPRASRAGRCTPACRKRAACLARPAATASGCTGRPTTTLIDHPVEMGTQVVSFTAHGAEHELVFTGVAPSWIWRASPTTCAASAKQIAFFEPRTRHAPFLDSADRYVFMTMVTNDGYGGLEHRASTALMTARKDLPVLGQQGQGEGYRGFLGLVSHEYFHTWNVKRIKPAAFAPYDLSQPDLTRLLWVFEGFTSYYDDLLLLRSGAITQADYLRLLAKTITGVARTPGRLKQSVAESSFDAWTRYYKQDENSPSPGQLLHQGFAGGAGTGPADPPGNRRRALARRCDAPAVAAPRPRLLPGPATRPGGRRPARADPRGHRRGRAPVHRALRLRHR